MLWRLFALGYHDTARFWSDNHGRSVAADYGAEGLAAAKAAAAAAAAARGGRAAPPPWSLPPEAVAPPSRAWMLLSLAGGWLQMLLLTLLFPLLPLGLAACQLLSARAQLDSAAGRLSVLLLLRRGAMLALLVAVWPLLLVGLVIRWCTLTPSTARASFEQTETGPGLSSRPESPLVRRKHAPPSPPVGRPVHA